MLCAPATFHGRRTGALPVRSQEKVRLVDPRAWSKYRHVTQERTVSVHRVGAPWQWRGHQHVASSLSDGRSVFIPAVVPDALKTYRAGQHSAMRMGFLSVLALSAMSFFIHHAMANTVPPSLPAVTIAAPALASTAPDSIQLATIMVRPDSDISDTPAVGMLDKNGHISIGAPIVVFAPATMSHIDGFNLDIASHDSLWAKAGKRYGLDPMLIYAVAMVETRATQPDGSVSPTPWIVRINGHLHSGSRVESEHAIELAHLMAVPVQDVGIMQVYYPMHRDIEPDPIALLNPARNIEIGTRLLSKAMKESADPILRIGYYHSHDAELARGYGQTVLAVYQQLKMVKGRNGATEMAMAHRAPSATAINLGG